MIFDVIVFPLAAFALFRDLSGKNARLNHAIPIVLVWNSLGNTGLSYSLSHVDHSLTLIMDISNFWKHCYSFTHASFDTVYNYKWLTAIISVTVSLHYLPRLLSVFNSHMQGSHSVISNKPRLHTRKKTESLSYEQKHMTVLIWINTIIE